MMMMMTHFGGRARIRSARGKCRVVRCFRRIIVELIGGFSGGLYGCEFIFFMEKVKTAVLESINLCNLYTHLYVRVGFF